MESEWESESESELELELESEWESELESEWESELELELESELELEWESVSMATAQKSAKPTIPSYRDIDDLKRNRRFSKGMLRAIEIKQQLEELDVAYHRILSDDIEPELVAAGVGNSTVDFQGWRVRVVDKAPGLRLDKKQLVKELLGHGVDPSIIQDSIADASAPTEGSHYTELRRPTDGNEDGPDQRIAKEVSKVLESAAEIARKNANRK